MKNYVKEKLTEATCVVIAASGLTIAIALDRITARRQYQDSAWRSRLMNPSVIPNAMVKWMEDNKRRVVFDMWGLPEALDKLNAGHALNATPEAVAEAKAKREAEQKIEEEGKGTCANCKEEIVKNERAVWESDYLLEYCATSKDHKHRPKIVWKET